MSKRLYTILVIDDEPIVRTTLAALLEKPNNRVEMAEDGAQGIEMAKQIHPDVILLDVMMPHMNGYEVCKLLRSDPQFGEVPIIMITALDDREAKLNGLSAGADDFLSKPFDQLELDIRLQTLHRVDRYRHLLDEREKLQQALAELTIKNSQLQTLSRQILTAQEDERRQVAVELHNDIGQLLTGLKLILERREEAPSSQLSEARSLTTELMQRVREISRSLHPSVLDDFGLHAALDDMFKRFSKQTRIHVHHNIDPLEESRFDKTLETTVFRIIQEALTNIARHAETPHADVLLTHSSNYLEVTIADKGKGFDINLVDPGTSTGLSGISERIKLAGGQFSMKSSPGQGSILEAKFELRGEK